MIGETPQIKIIIDAVDNASKTLEGVAAKTGLLGESFGIATGLVLAGGAALATVAGVSIKMAGDFQQSMDLVQTQAGASAEEVRNMSKAILDMAPALGSTPKQMAEGLFYIESAGFRGAQALDILKLSAEGAAVGEANLADVANGLTSIINSGISGVKNATEAMGVLNAVVGGGKMHMQDLIASLSTGILPAARAVGISIQDVGAAMDVMTNNGIVAQDGATRLRMTLSLMEAPTHAAIKALSSIGLTQTQIADDMRNKGLGFALQDLKTHLEKAGLTATEQAQVLTKAFGGARSGTLMELLIQNTGQFNDRLKNLKDTSNNFGESWKKTQEDFDFQFKKMMATLAELAVKFGDVLLPTVTKVVDYFNQNLVPTISRVSTFLGQHKEVLAGVAAIIGTVVLMAVINLTAGFAGLVIAMAPFLLAMAAIGIAGAILYTAWTHDWGGIREKTEAVINFIKGIPDTLKGLWDTIVKDFDYIKNNWSKVWTEDIPKILGTALGFLAALAVKGLIFFFTWPLLLYNAIWDHRQDLFNIAKDIINGLVGFFEAAVPALVKWFTNLPETLMNAFKGGFKAAGNFLGSATSSFTKAMGFASGGFIPGPIGAPQLAIVHGGEQVLSPEMQGGMGATGGQGIVINMSGNFNLDSQERIQELATTIIKMLGEQTKLAGYGL